MLLNTILDKENQLKSRLLLLFSYFLFLLVTTRLIFLAYHIPEISFSQFNILDIIILLPLSLFNDLTVALLCCTAILLLVTVFLLLMRCLRLNTKQAITKIFFTLSSTLLSLLVALSLVEIFYFGYFNNRFHMFFWDFITDAAKAQQFLLGIDKAVSLIFIIPALLLLLFLTIFGFYHLTKSNFVNRVELWLHNHFRKKRVLWPTLFVIVSTLLFSVSGFSKKATSNNDLVQIVSDNSVSALLRSYQQRKLFSGRKSLILNNKKINRHSFATLANLISKKSTHGDKLGGYGIQYKVEPIASSWLQRKPRQIVLIIAESMSAWPLEYHQHNFNKKIAPNLMRFKKNGIYFPMHFHQGSGTMRNLQAIFFSVGIPDQHLLLSFSKNGYKNYQHLLGKRMTRLGYKTYFYYGSSWRESRLGYFLKKTGFNKLIGSDPKQTSKQLTDEQLFKKLFHTLKTEKKPGFHCILTSANHPPFHIPKRFSAPKYTIPNQLRSRIKQKNNFHEHMRAYQYTDYAIGKFIHNVSKQPFFKETLFIITGDHHIWGLLSAKPKYALQHRRVPMLFYGPGVLKKREKTIKHFTSHFDILPTLLSLLSDKKCTITTWGSSMFDPEKRNNLFLGSNALRHPYLLHKKNLYRIGRKLILHPAKNQLMKEKLKKTIELFNLCGLWYLYNYLPNLQQNN